MKKYRKTTMKYPFPKKSQIDQLISRESSASPNLVGDQAAHPVCDH